MSSGRLYLSLAIWCALYFATGYLSLYLDDPISRVSLVWFPAGIAVSAFLIVGRPYWLVLFVSLFIVRALLDVTMRHTLETSLIHSAISLTNDIAIAWCVRRLARPNDRLHAVLIWLLATLLVSAIAALLGCSWLATRHEIDFRQTLWIWWAANVVGTILITTIVMGLCWKPEPFTPGRWLVGGLLWLLLCASAWYVFHQPIGGPRGQAELFGLACIPVALMIAIPVLGGNRMGAFSLLCFSAIVIYYSWQWRGPFFIPGLHHGEPLLLAQCYLSGTALLLSFVYIQKRAAADGQMQQQQGPGHGRAAYYLAPESGRLTWDENIDTPLSQQLLDIDRVDRLLALLSVEEREVMQARWQAARHGEPPDEIFHFHLTLTPSHRIPLQESKLVVLRGPEGMALVGYWDEAPHSKVSIHRHREA